MSDPIVTPHSPTAEWNVVATILREPAKIVEVVGTQLAAEDFYRPDFRALYATAVELHYSDLTVDPITVGQRNAAQLAASWNMDEGKALNVLIDRVRTTGFTENVLEHATMIRTDSVRRQLMHLAFNAVADLGGDRERTPEEVGDMLSSESLRIVSGMAARQSIDSWMDLGANYARYLKQRKIAKERGIEMAVYTGLRFIDDWTKGIEPGELCFIGGEPGAGKSSVAWEAVRGFAQRQLQRPDDNPPVAALVLSLEMGKIASAMRLAQSITGIDGARLREADITAQEYQHLLREWKNRENLPIHFNFASNFRLSQMRALIVEAIRRHHVGLVVIDHFRMLDTDRYVRDANERDEAKVRFLKENVATDLNVAVMCLAHTVKIGRQEDPRPQLGDLRGSGQVAAHADLVGFVYRPYKYAGEEEAIASGISENDAEMLWRKNRFGGDGIGKYVFEPATMTIRDRPHQHHHAGPAQSAFMGPF